MAPQHSEEGSQPTEDPRGAPVPTMSPYFVEGRIQFLGNLTRAIRYGRGRRGRIARGVAGAFALILLIFLVASLLL